MGYKSGFVSIIGRPNAGKSTILNNIIGEKVSIVSSKPQTTRNTIRGILTTDEYQVVFMDTPGIHAPKNKLGHSMIKSVENSIKDIDAIIFVVDCTKRDLNENIKIINNFKKTPVILVLNKIDCIEKENILSFISDYKDLYDFECIIPVSAKTGDGIDILVEEVLKNIEEGPQYFPEDMVVDNTERVYVSEIIREKILHLIDKEVPHGVAVNVIRFSEREREGKEPIIDIDAEIICEKKSHKGILIGKNGSMLKKIGSNARIEIEEFFGIKINLKLWVKVKEEWRNSDFLINNFGFND